MNWYLSVLKKYAVFDGRARRKEYWMFVLFNILAMLVIALVESLLGLGSNSGGVLSTLYSIAVLLPSIGVSIRRLHDTNRSGWLLLLVLIPFIGWLILLFFTIQEGTRGANKYGANPKELPNGGANSVSL